MWTPWERIDGDRESPGENRTILYASGEEQHLRTGV